MANKIQLRRDTAANWTTANPVLGQGEPGAEIDTGRLKIGDGVKDWKTLPDIAQADLQFTQAGTGAKPRSLTAKLRDTVSVKDFGAVGDGNADDTVAIQAAIDSGKPAYVPAGTYKISATLNLNNGYKALIGDASLPAIVKTTAGPAIRIGTTTGAVLNEYSRVENLYLRCTAGTPSFTASPGPNEAGVVLDGSSSSMSAAVANARVYNVRVGDWPCGFYTNDVVGCRIEGCFVQLLSDRSSATGFTSNNKFVGFLLDSAPRVTGGISPQASIELVDNDFGGSGTPSSVTSIGYYVVGPDIRDIFFDRCESAGASYGWFITTETADFNWDVHIRRPIVDAFKNNGIFITGASGLGAITIDGGYFVGTGATAGACIRAASSSGVTVTGGTQLLGLANDLGTDDGIQFDQCNSCSVVGNSFVNLNFGVSLINSKGCTIVGNHFYGAATVTEPHPALIDAIRVFNGSEGNTIVGNAIKGKDATDQYDRGINVTAGCPRNVVSGNSIDNVSVIQAYSISDATTTLISTDATTISSSSVLLKSNDSILKLQGSDAATPVAFLGGGSGAAVSQIRADGGYKASLRLNLQGNDATYPIVFLDGGGNPLGKINNTGVYSPGAP